MSVREILLFAHQSTSVDAMRAAMSGGQRRVVLVAPTGFGKTECAAYVILQAIAKGANVLFIVDRITLIDQTSRRFDSYGIDHGVIQARHERTAPEKQVQIASAQTLARRKLSCKPDLIIVDEAHCQYKAVLDLIRKTPNARVIGLTATPFSAGMADHWDGLVNGATVNQLRRPDRNGERFLADVKIRACVTPDMKAVRLTRKGEYDEESAGEVGITIIGNVLETWVAETMKAFGRVVPTLVFSPSVKWGEEFCRRAAAAGYNFQLISYLDDTDEDRRAKIDEFQKPDSAIHGLVSCAVLTKGFDAPHVLCGISCRPYRKSFSSHIQEMGRVMRRAPGKDFALWLCHSGNAVTFEEDTAWLYEHGVDRLSEASKKDSVAREPKERAKSVMFCRECGAQMEPGAEACDECGWERPKRSEVRVIQGELIDIDTRVTNAFRPRAGLRAGCLSDPKRIWSAALTYCKCNSAKGDMAARRWAFGIWRGIYPDSRLPAGLFEAPCDPGDVHEDEWGLIEREVRRFRSKPAARSSRAA